MDEDDHAEYGAEVAQEESKIASDRATKKAPKQVAPKLQAPYALIEGPEPSQDLSYKWVNKYENVREIEKGVSLSEFNGSMLDRELDAEFRLIRKLTETKEHLANCEAFDKKTNALLNRYAELKPFKHTRVRLLQRNEDKYDSYINANYINTSTSKND
jgi:hypothetical protein